MPVTYTQDIKQKDVVFMKYEGNWTVAEYEQAYNEMLDYAAKSGHEIYLISDFMESGSVPPNILSLASRTTRKLPENIALIVVINSSRFVNTLIDIAGKLNRDLGKKTIGVRSLEEAYTEVERHKNSLGN
ncbi:MAG: hypothetical protein H7Y09_04795 [Chitinophagaceae bacterium]|nr:hypothetical protein [Anaerolineae bacterium]